MKHEGKLPQAVVGELMHVINNDLNSILACSAKIGGESAQKIEDRVMKIAAYVKSLSEKEHWNSNPFEKEAA